MKFSFEWGSFKTRVARRVFLLFIACAIVPTTVLGGVAYFQVKRSLEEQHMRRLRQESRAVALSIYERFQLLRQEVRTLAVAGGLPGQIDAPPDHFTSWRWETTGEAMTVPKEAFSLAVQHPADGPRILLRYYDPAGRWVLSASLDPSYLWEAVDRLPQDTHVVIAQNSGPVLFASRDTPLNAVQPHMAQGGWRRNGQMDWTGPQGRFLAGYAVLFLEPLMDADSWVVVVVTPAAQALELMSEFKVAFPALIVFSLGLVFMMGQYLIRRSTDPIETLREGTRQITDGRFGYEVDIRSNDEFEDLGHAFNEMSRRLKDTQALLIRTARMGTMGQMASGIVHEVKQPLSAIHGLVQLVIMDPTVGKENVEKLETVIDAVEALDTSLNRFRSFSQETPLDLGPLDLNDTVEEVYRLLAIRFRKQHMDCRLLLAPALPLITGDRRGIQQVLSNLMVNAIDALEEHQGEAPRVTIRTRHLDDRVELSVADNAGGIPEAIRDKIFDPFFTTKSAEKGTGLGMAIVESILHQHGAHISLESAPGAGTTIRMFFTLDQEGVSP